MIKIFWITDIKSSGYATASKCLLKGLLQNKKYDIYLCPINYYEEPEEIKKYISNELPISKNKIFPIPFYKNMDGYTYNYENENVKKYYYEVIVGLQNLKKNCLQIKPDIIISINDNSIIGKHLYCLDKCYKKWGGIFIGYMPIDCYNFPKNFFKEIEKCDYLITMTEYGKKEIIKSGFNKKIFVLEHTVQINKFKPIPNSMKKKIRSQLLGPEFVDKFIIMNLNMSIMRKRTDITLESFKKFSENKKDVILVLRVSNNVAFTGMNVLKLIKKYNVDINKIRLIDKKFDINILNLLYNCADVGINTSSGEGWGLIPCEMSLCKIPQIIPNNTSYTEIFDELYDLIKVDEIPINEGRLNINNIINGGEVMCFLKSYISFDKDNNGHKYQTNIKIDHNIFTVIISESGKNTLENNPGMYLSENVVATYNFNDLEYASEVIKSNLNLYDRFQILIQYGKNFSFVHDQIKKYKDSKFFEHKNRWTMQQGYDDIKTNFESYFIKVGIPNTDDTVRILNKYYYNRDLITLDGDYCYNRIMNNFTPEKIILKFDNIIEEINKN